jgi:hypothetical protein
MPDQIAVAVEDVQHRPLGAFGGLAEVLVVVKT